MPLRNFLLVMRLGCSCHYCRLVNGFSIPQFPDGAFFSAYVSPSTSELMPNTFLISETEEWFLVFFIRWHHVTFTFDSPGLPCASPVGLVTNRNSPPTCLLSPPFSTSPDPSLLKACTMALRIYDGREPLIYSGAAPRLIVRIIPKLSYSERVGFA